MIFIAIIYKSGCVCIQDIEMATDGLLVFILVCTSFAGASTLTDSCVASDSDQHSHCDASKLYNNTAPELLTLA